MPKGRSSSKNILLWPWLLCLSLRSSTMSNISQLPSFCFSPLFYLCPLQWCLAKVASVPNLPYSMGLLWPLLLLWIFHLPWNKLSALGFFGFCFLVALLLTALFSFWATFPFSDVNHYVFQIFLCLSSVITKSGTVITTSGTVNQNLR